MTEKKYIRYRKLKAFGNSLAFYICRIFPIDKKLVSVCTFEGKGGFGCNPKYVVEEMHRRNKDYKFVWFVNDDSKEFPDYIKKVPNTLWSRAYWLSRSKIWIDNYRKPYGTVKRNGQYYLNTNHYTIGIKCVGLWRGSGFSKMAYLVSKNDSDMIDGLVIDSKFCEEMCPKGLIYDGNYLKTGAPRCDVLYGDRIESKKRFRKKHGIEPNAKVVMFAPTFREGAKNGVRSVYSEIWTIDFERMIKNLEKKFGGKWYICVRVHPQLAPTFEDYKESSIQDRIINENQADDMYEILAGMDAYVTDYSSACFEAGFTKMPVFIYADDIEKYTKFRGALYWEFDKYKSQNVPLNREIFKDTHAVFPYPITTNNEELENAIISFDENKYEEKIEKFNNDIELKFTGNASKELVDMLESREG